MGFGKIVFSDDVSESTSIFALKANNYSNGNANVTDDGVRLRKKPSLSSVILELMYNGESVLINYTKSYEKGFNSSWFYVKRIKTGTCGWVKKSFIAEWD